MPEGNHRLNHPRYRIERNQDKVMKATSTPLFARLLGALLLGLLAVAFPVTVSASTSATITLELVGAPSLEEGTTFQVRAAVTGNDSATTPTGANIRLTFDSVFVTPITDDPDAVPDPILSVISNDGFTVARSAVLGSSPANYIDIFVGANINEILNPELCLVEFEVV